MKNVTAHIKALRHHLNAKEAELYIQAENWKSKQQGTLHKWQKAKIDAFLTEKALITTICDSWEELRDHIVMKEDGKKLDYLFADTRLLLINSVFHKHFNMLFKWLQGVENKKENGTASIEELSMYNIVDELTAIIQTQDTVKQYSNIPQINAA